MKRGTEWEEQAVKETWAAMEERKRKTTALLFGSFLFLTGFMITVLVLGGPYEVCIHNAGIRNPDPECTTQLLILDSVRIPLFISSLMILIGGYVIQQNTSFTKLNLS